MCARETGPNHGHIADTRERRILCACRPCYLLFTPSGASRGRFKAIESRHVRLTGLEFDDGRWEALQIPIGLAFFFYSTPAEKMVAFYPSPAGATESLLPLNAWDELARSLPELETMEHDVEALLIRRTGEGVGCYIVPIDACYELVGLIRSTWKGFDGGDEARRSMREFFERIDGACAR